MTHHERYGEPLNRAGVLRHFPTPPNASNTWGIVYTNQSVVAWLTTKVGAGQSYPNEVSRDVIRYCYGPDKLAHQSMTRMWQEGLTFKIKVIPDKSTATYLWGTGKITVLEEVFNEPATNKMYQRYVIARVPEADGDTGDAPDGGPAVKRPRGAVETTVDGVVYDSICERRHKCVMEHLGIPYKRTAWTFHDIHLSATARTCSYTPDYIAYPRNPITGATECLLMEIKPRYPYDQEIERAMGAVAQSRIPLVILFNTVFRCPFDVRPETPGEQGKYEHADGVRGIRLEWSSAEEKVVFAHDAGYCVFSDPLDDADGTIATVRARPDPSQASSAPFTHPKVRAAFRAASELRIET
jgi:hypothetical protein